nr:hypothetical protein [Dyadobacter sp.]
MKLFKSLRLRKVRIRFPAAWLLIPLLSGISYCQSVDLLIKGGHVIDPKNRVDGVMDVAITGGKVVQVATAIPSSNAKKVIEAGGMYVAPGFIDMHVHVFNGVTPEAYIANAATSVAPDGFTFRTGVNGGRRRIVRVAQFQVVQGTNHRSCTNPCFGFSEHRRHRYGESV